MRTRTITFIAIVMLCSPAVPSAADYTYWDGSSGPWTEETNWTLGVPLAGDTAYINNGGTATVNATATATYLFLGQDADESGTVQIEPTGDLSIASATYIGWRGTGELIQTGGSHTVYGVSMGIIAGATGTYDLSGTGTLSAHGEDVGFMGTATFTQTGGTNTVGWDVILGGDPTGVGRYELSGTAELSIDTYLFIGKFGKGEFVQTGGTVAMGGPGSWIVVGYEAGSQGAYELGAGAVSSYGLIVARGGTGAFTQTGGTVTLTEELEVAYGSTSHGTYEMTGGELDVTGPIIINSNGAFTLDGGTVRADDIDISGGGKFRWFSGRLEIPSLTIGPGGPLGADLFLGSDKALEVPSPVVVETGGALILSGGSYECNSTQLAGGVLTATRGMSLASGQQIAGEGAIYGSVDLTDAAIAGSGGGLVLYGDLSGTGTVSECTIYGEVSVGHSPGRMTMRDVVFGGGTRLNMEIGGLGSDDCDEIVFVGDAALSGRMKVLLIGGFSPARGDRFDLFDWTSCSGGFGPIDLPVLPNDLEWDTSDLYVTGQLAVVPEPATLSLLALGGLSLLRKRRKQ